MDEIRTDLVVVGAGVAGLTAAISAAEAGLQVTVINKGRPWRLGVASDTATQYAQGGIAVVDPTSAVDPDDGVDSVARHLADTLVAGAGHSDPVAARAILADGYDAVAALIGWGAHFDTDIDGRLLRTREGGHGVRRIIHAGGDATGAQVQRALGVAVRRWIDAGRVRVVDDSIVTSILMSQGRAVGVAVRDADGRVAHITGSSVLLATGGLGHLYAATTNPAGSTGDGIALALCVGAEVSDLEFIQFHPTMLYSPGARGRRTLISEAVRGEGAVLVDSSGRSIMDGVHPLRDLAPRDVVARAVHSAKAERGEPCVYLDARGVPDVAERFPTVTAGVRAIGIDPQRQLIPVVPGAHYLCGGVVTDIDGRTSIDGLLAAGEVARTGLHGANRLASNSLLEGLVMGRRAAVTAETAVRAGISVTDRVASSDTDVRPVVSRSLLQDAMSASAAVVRDASGLGRLNDLIDSAPIRRIRSIRDVEDANLTAVAAAVVHAAVRREGSLGCHFRSDDLVSEAGPENGFHATNRLAVSRT
ncbi:L-aspartate oxidase [Williamsia phyllosphaerae]|uniref:L-aspartate oxidase n=1 Tax=Williamsia phyllosphaerae TaxID=885042 RepID=A0ABQ1UIR4_9NOCA|nr:L-aspartate oxidase [Williamsia phyllosphaerae]GGF18036.1 L-aspartate oxidase [Williamsia phyllosphaerae]